MNKHAGWSNKKHLILTGKYYTFGKLTSEAAIIAIVEEQTNAAELDSPDPVKNQ